MIPTRSGSKPFEPGVGERLAARAERDQHAALELARLLRRGDGGRVEVLDLAGDAHREVARVERLDEVDAALARERGAPGRRRVEPERRDRPDAGDRHRSLVIGASLVIGFGHARRERTRSRDPVPADGGRARARAARRATAGGTSRSGTASAACSRTSAASSRLWSRNARPLLRYFPELRPLGELLPPRSALDGEIVIVRDGALDFDAMQMRLHPAESRIRKLSAEIPAEFVAFDVLLWDGEPVWERPLAERRARARARREGLPALAARRATWTRCAAGSTASRRSASTASSRRSRPAVPAGLARRRRQGEGAQDRRLRRHRRPLQEGLAATRSRRCCSASSATTARSTTSARARSRRRAAPRWRSACCRCSSASRTEHFSEPNRWGTGELEQAWVRKELVVEVRYDKVQGNRFRHGTKWLRWRDDKDPRDCTWRELRPPRDPNAPASSRCSPSGRRRSRRTHDGATPRRSTARRSAPEPRVGHGARVGSPARRAVDRERA